MKALLYQGLGKLALQDIPTPQIGEGEALIAVEVCGLCGSDILKIDSDIRARPVPLGHEVTGRIVELGPGVKKFKKGDRVVVAHHVPCLECHYCRRGNESMCREFKATNLDPGGFSQLLRASARHVAHTMLRIPAGLGYAEAAMMEPVACCLRNLRRMGLASGDCAVVVGLGFIGLLTSQLLKLKGVSVIGLDLDPARVRLAQKLGVEAYTGKEGRTDQIISERTEARGADALVFTAGDPALVCERLGWLRDGGLVNIFASFSDEARARLDLNAVYFRELTIMSSYSPQLRDLEDALAIIAARKIDLRFAVKDGFALDRIDEALRQVRGREILKALLLPQKIAVGAPAAAGRP